MRELYLHVHDQAWIVERREDAVPPPNAYAGRHTRPVLLFHGPGGEIRRAEIADDFPESPSASVLEDAWRNAEVTQMGDPGEMQTAVGMVVPRIRDWLRLSGRALLLHCPNCGGHPVLASWFKLAERCPVCGLRLERGEEKDYFLGGLLFNLVLAEMVFAVIFGIALLALWPNVPWDGIEYVIAFAVFVAPFAFYPISKLLWLAMDLAMRPPTNGEMQWHHESAKPGKSNAP